MSELKISYDSEGNKYIRYKNASYSCDKNINDIAYNGKCIVYTEGFGEYKGYCCDILNKPTFQDLLIIANDRAEYTYHCDHHFFEGVEIKGLIAGDVMEIGLF